MPSTIQRQPQTAVGNGALRDRLRALRAENEQLRQENQRLRDENRALRRTLDAYVGRARSTALFGPLELTAGTCVGPRR